MKKIIRTSIFFVLCSALLLTSGFCYQFSTTDDAEKVLLSDSSTPFVPYVEDGVVIRIATTGGTILSRHNPVLGQEDVNTNFVHYASGDSRVSLPSVYTSVDNDVSNIVGVVLNFEDDTPIPGAVVSANGEELVSTDSSGRFQITNLPDGEYNWEVTADGYMKGSFLNYDVTNAGGANIYRFYLSRNEEYFSNSNDFEYGSHMEQSSSQLDVATAEGVQIDYPILPNAITKPNPVLSSVPNAYDEVLVKINNTIKPYDRDEYLWYTICAEQYLPNVYLNTFDLTDVQLMQVYVAQALVSNTYIEFQQKIYLRHDGDYDILAGTDHAFDPTLTFEAIVNGVKGVFYTVNNKPCTVIIYYKPSSSSYQYLNAEWFSSCKNKGTIDSPWGWPGVKAKSCSDYFTGHGGHQRGYCQSGGTQRIVNGEVAVPAAKYYFTDVNHGFAQLVSRPKNLS